ncbi:hypothetical protein BDQ17DRAFT_1429541 [Cyathus striatus]|nr:hypothetical protein BDQ17DRAFT_1429541 [Cyathus striatus]
MLTESATHHLSSLSPVFPLEIFELVIDEIASSKELESRFRGLNACALTCRDFLIPSRRHLFHQITLNHNYYRTKSFYDALTSSPWITHYVRHVILDDEFEKDAGCESCDEYAQYREDKDDHDGLLNPEIPNILSLLKNVNNLEVFFYNHTWDYVSSEFKKEFTTLLLSPCLMHLHLSHAYDLPSTYLKLISRIPRVTLTSVTFGTQDEDCLTSNHEVSIPRSSYLRHLTLRCPKEVSSMVAESFSPPNCYVETLNVQSWSRPLVNFHLAQQIAYNNRNSLTTLTFADALELPKDIQKYDIDVIPNLKNVKFAMTSDSNEEDPFDTMKQFLTMVTRPNNVLEEITLDLSRFSYFDSGWAEKSYWNALENFLTNREQFANLRTVHIHGPPIYYWRISYNTAYASECERRREQMRTILGRIEKRGLVVLGSYSEKS